MGVEIMARSSRGSVWARVFAAALAGALHVLSATAAPGSVTYTYDEAGRLKAAQHSDGSVRTYSLDPAGNRVTTIPIGPPMLAFSAATYVVSEGGGSVTITVTRTVQSSGAVSVQYATIDGSAVAGKDYTAASGTLNWASGDSSAKTFSVPITNDTIYDGNETFTVRLTNPTGGAVLGFQSSAPVTITDNDTVTLSIANVSVSEGAGVATLTVTRTGSSLLTQSVSYSTAGGTATPDVDYVSRSDAVTFTPLDTSKTITVPILEDSNYEGNETFTVTLSSPTNGATLGNAVATVTITDDDPAPSFSISPVAKVVSELTSTVTFTVTKSATNTVLTHAVNYATVAGTATASSDYTPTSGTLSFLPTDFTKTFNVTILNDSLVESNETFTVLLSSPTYGATISVPQSTVTIMDDDNPILSVPQNLAGTESSQAYNISWDVSSGQVAYYTLQRSQDPAFGSVGFSQNVTPPATSLGFAQPLTSKTYYFRVNACNSANACTAWSTILQFQVSGTN